jgi:hypothetical protein
MYNCTPHLLKDKSEDVQFYPTPTYLKISMKMYNCTPYLLKDHPEDVQLYTSPTQNQPEDIK